MCHFKEGKQINCVILPVLYLGTAYISQHSHWRRVIHTLVVRGPHINPVYNRLEIKYFLFSRVFCGCSRVRKSIAWNHEWKYFLLSLTRHSLNIGSLGMLLPFRILFLLMRLLLILAFVNYPRFVRAQDKLLCGVRIMSKMFIIFLHYKS